jgi:hypothetical protein
MIFQEFRLIKIYHLIFATDLHKTFHIITTKKLSPVCVSLWLNRQLFENLKILIVDFNMKSPGKIFPSPFWGQINQEVFFSFLSLLSLL